MSENLNVVGKNVKMVRSFEKVSGRATYNNDVRLPGMLHARVLRSPHANAEIVAMDVDAAASLPGVKLVMSHQNFGQIFGPHVYYVGAEVAVVVAATEEIAEAALDRIKVEYKVNPFVIDPQKAMAQGAPKAFPKVPQGTLVSPQLEMSEAPSAYPNVNTWAFHKRFSEKNEKGLYTKQEVGEAEGFGDVAEGFARADLIVEENGFKYNLAHVPTMSPNCCVADFSNGRLTLYLDSQWKHGYKAIAALCLGLAENQVNVVAPYTGGSFGGRLGSGIMPADILPTRTGHGFPSYGTLAAVAAMALGKPVKLEYAKHEDFYYHWGRGGFNETVKLGFTKDGTLTTVDAEIWRNATTGGNASANAMGPFFFDATATGNMLYSHNCRHSRMLKKFVYTNGPGSFGWQGFGNPEVFFAVESTMDIAAERLGIDPIELRKKNHIRPGDNVLESAYDFRPEGHYLVAGDISKCLDQGAEAIGWQNRKPAGEKSGRIRSGLGVSLAAQQTGGAGLDTSTIVKLQLTGTAHLVCGYADIGQGGNTAQMQIVAEVLGLPYDKITETSHDTDSTPYCGYQACSSGTIKQGYATYQAAVNARDKLFKLAAPLLDAQPDDLATKDGAVFLKEDPQKMIPWMLAFKEMAHYGMMSDIVGYHSHVTTGGPTPMELGATFASLGVDTETGQLLNIKIVHAQDCGKAIYPKAVEGVYLTIHHGIESLVGAELILDPKTGKQLNNSWVDYPVASILDAEVAPIIVETPGNVTHPYGATGIGQSCQNGLAAAVGNAIYNAIGVRMKSVPFTPQKILEALGKI